MNKTPHQHEKSAAASSAATITFAPHTTARIDAGCR
jgi:hypothetical protein